MGKKPATPPPAASDAEKTIPVSPFDTNEKTHSPKKLKKGLIITLASIGALILVVGGALLFVVIHNNPEKVVSETLAKTLSAKSVSFKGKLTTASTSGRYGDDTEVQFSGIINESSQIFADVSIDFEYGYQSFKVNLNVVADNGKLYFKINNLKSLLTELSSGGSGSANMMSQFYVKYYTSLVEKIDGKWISVSDDDLKGYTNSDEYNGEKLACVQNALAKFGDDKSAIDGFMKVYNETKPFAVKTNGSNQDGSRYMFVSDRANDSGEDGSRYILIPDKANIDSFLKAVKGTQLFKLVDDCSQTDIKADVDSRIKINDEIKSGALITSESELPNIEVWINAWSRTLNRIVISSTDSDDTFELRPTFNDNQKVEIPTDTIPLKDLQSELYTLPDGEDLDLEE